MKTVALLGDPLTHSRSPRMHNAAFAHLGLYIRYETWPTPAADLPARVAALRSTQVIGANITLPHKIAIVPLLDALEPEAERIGAVNTIYKRDDGALIGANTDAPALLEALREEAGYAPENQTVVLLGASGAARAAAYALVGAGVEQLVIVNRTLERAEELLADVLSTCERDPLLFACVPNDDALPALLARSSLIINATSLGWRNDETPLSAEQIPPDALVYDMVYRPTRLLRDAAARGARTCDGLGMLVRQGGLAFTRWTGRSAPLDVMRAALQH